MSFFNKAKKILNRRTKTDWNKEIKEGKLSKNLTEQHSFEFSDKSLKNNQLDTSCPKPVLCLKPDQLNSRHIEVLRECKYENSANELMKIYQESNKTRFKNNVLYPLINLGFFEQTIPDAPKSPKQRYRATGKFIKQIAN